MLLKDYYGLSECCDEAEPVEGWVKLSDGTGPFNEDFIRKVFKGELKDGQIHSDYYFNVGQKLTEAVAKGLKISTFSIDSPQLKLFEKLKENIFAFSAAKSLAALQEYKNALTNENGEFVSYGQFRQKVTEVDEWFNDAHLQTEYKSARAMSQMADKWHRLKDYSHLEYRTVGDNRVRPAHQILDGLILESSDPMWDKIWPPNDWNCRCTVLPAPGSSVEGRERGQTFVDSPNMKPYFKRNVGKEEMIFTEDHPYFKRMLADFKNGWRQLMAEENYGMPSVEKIMQRKSLPELQQIQTKAEALEKWENTIGGKKGSITIKSADGVQWNLNQNFKTHLIDQHAKEDRWKYMNNVREVLEAPDEVWSSRKENPDKSFTLYKRYIKYYKGKPLVFSYEVGKPNGWTMYDAKVSSTGRYEKLREDERRGVLIYRK